MAHIHLEDGSFTLLWALVWTIICIVVIMLCVLWLRRVRKVDNRAIVMAAMCTAAAFAVFQVSIPVFGGVHLNLTPLIGILTGPAIGGIIVLVVNIFSAAIGHGGWSLIGANALINLTEVIISFYVFSFLRKRGFDTFSRAGIATLLGLLAGNVVMICLIVISGVQGGTPGVGDQIPGLLQGSASLASIFNEAIGLATGLSLIAAINMGVAILEAVITGYIVMYIKKVRPDMLGEAKNGA